MALLLPVTPEPQSAEPVFLDSGGYQKPIGQGAVTRLDRLGDKWGLDVNMPPMRWAAAMVFVARLLRGRRERVLMKFPQPGFDPQGGNGGTAAVAAATGSSQVDIQGKAAAILEGQMVSHVKVATGRRYLYQVTAPAAAGRSVVSLYPRIRGPVAIGDVFEFSPPMIEGYPQGDVQRWTLEMARTVGLQFQIEEAE